MLEVVGALDHQEDGLPRQDQGVGPIGVHRAAVLGVQEEDCEHKHEDELLRSVGGAGSRVHQAGLILSKLKAKVKYI